MMKNNTPSCRQDAFTHHENSVAFIKFLSASGGWQRTPGLKGIGFVFYASTVLSISCLVLLLRIFH